MPTAFQWMPGDAVGGDLVVFGAEDRQGRALQVISALHHCAAWLVRRGIRVRFVAATPEVCTAAQVLHAQTGLEVSCDAVLPADAPDEVFAHAALYVAVVFSTPGKALALKAAQARAVPVLLAVQFPEVERFTAEVLENLGAAFDPLELAARIRSELLRGARPAVGGAAP